ncbi:hypothetical protein PMAC_003090 [Pneumocystis sp. 'macacae']|nr:hypothetical protein PMAC_003090 [Pneumocystis sp. 'macacae']
MPGRLNELSRDFVSVLETGGGRDVSLNRRWSNPVLQRPPDRTLLQQPSVSDLVDSFGLVSLFSQYSETETDEAQTSLEVHEAMETVDPSLFHNGLNVTGSSEGESSGLYTSLASSLNLLRRREMRLREMRARVDGMAERLALIREIRSIARRVSPVRTVSSSSLASSSTFPMEAMTWPSSAVRSALRGTLLVSDVFTDANGDTWPDDKVLSELDDLSDTRNAALDGEFSISFRPLHPSILSSYRIIDGVLFNLDGEQVGRLTTSNTDLRSCKELYDEMTMYNLFPCDHDDDSSLYFYSTIAHNESKQRRRKYSVDLCVGR